MTAVSGVAVKPAVRSVTGELNAMTAKDTPGPWCCWITPSTAWLRASLGSVTISDPDVSTTNTILTGPDWAAASARVGPPPRPAIVGPASVADAGPASPERLTAEDGVAAAAGRGQKRDRTEPGDTGDTHHETLLATQLGPALEDVRHRRP